MLSFRYGWLGALIGFLGFNAAIGLGIVEKAYVALSRNSLSDTGKTSKFEAAGHILNYLIQLAIVTIWGSFLAGIDEYWVQENKAQLKPGSTVEVFNWGAITFAVSIFAWGKSFSDTPLLRQSCIDIMDRISR